MREEIKRIGDVTYFATLGPGSPINMGWVWRVMRDLGVADESIDKLYRLNAPLSIEVWYYILLKFYDEGKLASFLNILNSQIKVENIVAVEKDLQKIGIYYKNGEFKRKILKLAVLVSGRGTNLQSIIDTIKDGDLNAEIVGVISNRRGAYALERARNEGIETFYIPARKGESREDYDKRLAKIIDEIGADLIVLAGFLRILSQWFVKRYRMRIINIHPSLLPAFAGLYGEKVHEAAIAHGVKVSGCTVHFVDEEVDHGPIIVQKCVEVRDDDTPESLASRVLEKEHECLVEAIKLIADGKIRVEGRRVIGTSP